ncbi:hypothetical protein, partial [Pseudomonas sp. 2995-3]|uniref:hypothetical protein n=1 Tax=Pseudomonas sp. 2995-3 TaxID=1712680 RepID=UPI001C45E16B
EEVPHFPRLATHSTSLYNCAHYPMQTPATVLPVVDKNKYCRLAEMAVNIIEVLGSPDIMH